MRPDRCNAANCVCSDGRDSDKPSNELIICETCGSNAIHRKCWQRNESYYCCFPIDSKSISNESSKSSKDYETIVEIRRKRKREHQTDDEKLDEKRRKKRRRITFQDKSTRPKAKDTLAPHGSKKYRTRNDRIIDSNFPIKKIRNGSFDEILRFTPRVLLYPLSSEQFNKFSKKIVEPGDSNRSLITSNCDNNNSTKKDISNSSFTMISPTRKNGGGKSFKNYTITSFFKPFK